jgi:hypothetical protein
MVCKRIQDGLNKGKTFYLKGGKKLRGKGKPEAASPVSSEGQSPQFTSDTKANQKGKDKKEDK